MDSFLEFATLIFGISRCLFYNSLLHYSGCIHSKQAPWGFHSKETFTAFATLQHRPLHFLKLYIVAKCDNSPIPIFCQNSFRCFDFSKMFS